MQFKFKISEFLKIIKISEDLSNRNQKETHKTISLKVTDDILTVYAYSPIATIKKVCNVEGSQDGECLVNSPKLLAIISRFKPEDAVATFSLKNNKLIVKVNKSKYELQTIDEILPLKEIDEQSIGEVTLDKDSFLHLFSEVEKFRDIKEHRQNLSGILLRMHNGKISSFASDGHRFASSFLPIEDNVSHTELNLTYLGSKFLKDIVEISQNKDILVQYSNDTFAIEINGWHLIASLITSKFPSTSLIENTEQFVNVVIVNRAALLDALKRLRSIDDTAVHITINENNCELKAINPDKKEEGEEIIDVLSSFQQDQPVGLTNFLFAFNISYLIDVCGTLKTDKIKIAVNDARTIGLFSAESSLSNTVILVAGIKV